MGARGVERGSCIAADKPAPDARGLSAVRPCCPCDEHLSRLPCLYAQADAHPLALLPAPSSPCVVARSLLDKGLEDKVALSRGGPAQLAKLERELKAAKQAVDAAHKAALEPAH